MRLRVELISLAFGLLLLVGCAEEPTPRPRGYFRIDLPEQSYVSWADSSVMAAEIPTAARVQRRIREGPAKWYDVRYSALRATVHLTWTPVDGALGELIEGAHVFKQTHESKAARIGSERVLRPEERVFGTLFKVEGDVASPFVFYLTDSTDNFLYGALYFDVRPNADSLAPVTERIRADMQHLATTLRWQ